jgi:nitroreductase
MSDVRQNPVAHPVPELVRRRWSPVAFSAEPVREDRLQSLFESARWAASCFNEQPWRFVVARRQDQERFDAMLGCLVDANRAWARHAPVLVLVCASKNFSHNGKPNRHAWFDAGQATAHLMLAAVDAGLYCHAMAGFDTDRARETWEVGDEADPVCVVALGELGDGSGLDDETAARDRGPRKRRAMGDFVFERRFGDPAGFARD